MSTCFIFTIGAKMKIGYLILAALLSSLMFCNSLALADNSISARDDQTGDCLQFGNCKD